MRMRSPYWIVWVWGSLTLFSLTGCDDDVGATNGDVDVAIASHSADASAHHSKTIDAGELTTGTLDSARLDSALTDAIAASSAAVTANAADIMTNASGISTNASNISTNAGDISTNAGNISTNAGNIATNTGNIATNATDIATNVSDIGSNAGGIASNASAISTNTTNITNNANAIASHNHDSDYVNLAGDTMTGPLEVGGAVTTTSITYSSPRTHTLVIPGAHFFARKSGLGWVSSVGLGGAYLTSTTGALIAPVQLPDGAHVVGLQAYFDDTSSNDMDVRLWREFLTGGFASYGLVSSDTNTGFYSRSATVDHTVTTSNSGYFIMAYSTGWSSSLKIKGVILTYEISEAL